MHTPGLHKKKKRPLSGKKRMKNFRKRISEGEASPEVVERQKEIARKSYESKKAKRAKEKTEYQEAIAKRDSLLLELDETKQKLADLVREGARQYVPGAGCSLPAGGNPVRLPEAGCPRDAVSEATSTLAREVRPTKAS